MIESHNVFIDDPNLLTLTALNYRECIKMPSIRDIRYKRAIIYDNEIAMKILTKDEVGHACLVIGIGNFEGDRETDHEGEDRCGCEDKVAEDDH